MLANRRNSDTSGPAAASAAASACSIERVVITDALARRASKPPDHEAENRALARLARALAGEPDAILQAVVETARELCGAESAGLSILELDGETEVFRWRAIAGAFDGNLMELIPRAACPCGEVVSRDALMLLREPARAFPALEHLVPYVHEALLAPWRLDGGPVGTLWLLSHRPEPRFDAEDARRLQSLAGFAAAGWRASLALSAAREHHADLERRVREGTLALRQSRSELNRQARLYETTLSTISDLAYAFDLAGRFVFANKPLLNLWRVKLDQVVGKTFLDFPRPPELAATLQRQIKEVIRTGARRVGEAPFTAPGGGEHYYEYVLNPVLDARGSVTGVAGSARDIADRRRAETALRQSEERHAFLLRLTDALRSLRDPLAIQETAARVLGEHLEATRAFYATFNEARQVASVEREFRRGTAASLVGDHPFATYRAVLDGLRSGEPVVFDDLDASPGIPPEDRSAYTELELHASINAPLVKDGKLVAAVCVVCAEPRRWTEVEVGLVHEVAERTWDAVERAIAEARLRGPAIASA